jgi:hypothetical protein
MRFQRSFVRLDVSGLRALALLFLSLAGSGTAGAQTPATPSPLGHSREVAAQRTLAPPLIDGVPNEVTWQSGSIADSFWVSDSDRPPNDATRVLVLYDERALYFAFICVDGRPELIRANGIARDAAPGFDDRVSVELDPVHNHRSISRFTVTARGTQSDAMAGGRAQKREWKGEWTAAAQRTPSGWTAEIAIPLGLLEFDPRLETIGINFIRYQNRTREWSEWANLTPRRFAEEAGHLTGLSLPLTPVSGRLAVMQYVTGALSRAADDHRLGGMNSGVDLRYHWQQGLTSVVSARPDFSGIETEVPDLDVSYTEKFVRDARPFFQEGAEFFGDREVFHSGRITDFDVAAKSFGRINDFQIGALATADTNTGRVDYVGRVVRELGPTFNVSATLAAANGPSIDNTTMQLQAGGRIGRNMRVNGNVARASTDGSRRGMRGRGELGYSTGHWYSAAWIDRTDADYVPGLGFLAADVIGTSGHGAYGGYTRAFGQAWMRRANAAVSFEERETTGGLQQRAIGSLYAGAETASNIHLNVGTTSGVYRPRGAAAGEWTGMLNQDRYHLVSAFYESPTGRFGYGAQYSWGLAAADEYATMSPSLWLAPSPHFSFGYSFERTAYDNVERQHVVSGTWQITGEQALTGRWVEYDGGYYRLSYRRTLGRGIDAFGVYTSDPYEAGQFKAKLVWTLLR